MMTIKCKYCTNLHEGWCAEVLDCLSEGKHRKFERKTNADNIRGMTDNELAEFLSDLAQKCFDCGADKLKEGECKVPVCLLCEGKLWVGDVINDDE